MTIWIISGVLGFVGGSAFIWFCKDAVQKAVLGANQLSANLHAKADAIAAAAKKV